MSVIFTFCSDTNKIAPGAVVNPTFYEIPAGHDGWVPGTGNANMVVQGLVLT